MIPVRPASRLRRWGVRLLLAGTVAGLYPGFVLGTTYAHWLSVDLPGGRHGPADAYRHSLASATVAYTGSPRWVEWVTAVMENGGKGDAARAMDAHNNRIGAGIGAQAASWTEMQAAVLAAVKAGGIDAKDPNRITWLPRERWQDRIY
jgi:hypothetical protein